MRFRNPFQFKRIRFFLFPLAFAVIALFPMFGKGMFLDGILYAIVSQNVAHDICGLWSLKITDSLYPHFNEHPPLVFALQSQFFKFFGDAYWVERLYSLITVLLSAWLIYLIYYQILRLSFMINGLGNATTTPHSDASSISTKSIVFPSSAWVLLLWISVPVVNRCAQNNMLENTMLVFVLASVWCYFQFLKIKFSSSIFTETSGSFPNTGSTKITNTSTNSSTSETGSVTYKPHSTKGFLWLFISGSMLLLAFMSKGFTGLFPFALPAIVVWVFRKHDLWNTTVVSNKKANQNVNPSTHGNANHKANYSVIIKISIVQTTIMLIGFAGSFALMTWIFPESAPAIQRYFDKQVLGSLEKVQTVSTRFKIVWDYLLALLPMLLVSILIGRVFNKNPNAKSSKNPEFFDQISPATLRNSWKNSPWSRVLILLSLTGVLPIMISLKQSDYYIYCVFPFVAMAVVMSFQSYWTNWENRLLEIRFWPIILTLLVLFFGGWGYVQAGKVQRDKQLWSDIDKIVQAIQVQNASQLNSILENQIANGDASQKSMVRANQESIKPSNDSKGLVLGSFRALKDDWYLQAYLYRYYGITVQNYRVPNDENQFEYFLTPKNYIRDSLLGLKPIHMGLNSYELWQK